MTRYIHNTKYWHSSECESTSPLDPPSLTSKVN
jgi:hypothetical protein